jgi:arylsulfatase A-like enzyme
LRSKHSAWLLALTALACARSEPPNLLLVTLDTTRADRLGSYGHRDARTPHLDAFAETAVVYENAYATSSWTLPSHASLFTGLLPMQHGAQTAPDGVSETLGYAVRPLDGVFLTLAERLSAAGYETAAFVAGPALSRELGVAQGFRSYDDDLSGPGESYQGRRAEVVADRAIAAIEAFGDAPWFVFVNFFDPHAPYRPPPPHDRGLPEADAAVLTRTLLERLARGVPAPTAGPLPLREREALEALRAGYDAEIAYMDLHLGRLLEAAGGLPSWIAITSDHGESFGEHHYLSHGAHLYEDGVRVPLIVRSPGAQPGRISTPVSNRTLFAEALAQAGLEPPPSAPRLAEPAGWIATEVGPSDANVRLFGPVFDRRLRALQVPPHKLIVSSRDEVELYDLVSDPQEQHDLADREPSLRDALRERLESLTGEHPPLYDEAARAELSPQTREALERLGYLD